MGLFNRKKKIIDLGERYRKRKAREERIASDSTESSQETDSPATPFSFFDSGSAGSASSGSGRESSDVLDLSDTGAGTTGRKKRLAKRILDMTTKLEDLSNQIYRLEQRVEVLERKSGRY